MELSTGSNSKRDSVGPAAGSAGSRGGGTSAAPPDKTRLPEHLFQEKNGQWYGDFAEYRIRSAFRPVYRRLEGHPLTLYGFEGGPRITALGREFSLGDVISAVGLEDGMKIERIWRAVQFRNFSVMGGGQYKIFLSHGFMTRRGLADFAYDLQEMPNRLARFGLIPDQLIAEFQVNSKTEADVLAGYVDSLRSIGARIALSRFGSEIESGEMLALLDPEYVVIDGLLLERAEENGDAAILLRSLVELIVGYGICCCIEGVDTAARLEIAASTKAELFRGDLLGSMNPRLIRVNMNLDSAALLHGDAHRPPLKQTFA